MSEKKDFSYIDLDEDELFQSNKRLMKTLLLDYSTGKNIRWATDNYSKTGIKFEEEKEIKADLITGWYKGLIMPRAEKDLKTRIERTRNKAEVFTPSWIIKKQVDAVVDEMGDLPLHDFINSRWLELACGEAPYMANRYDMLTGEVIGLEKRAGFIDEKFRRLNSQVENKKDWINLAVGIYKSSYGYEYQGDSLLLARQNLLLTFIDNYFYMFGEFPKDSLLLTITKIISENVFQMDGLTYQVPYSKDKNASQQLSMLEELLVEEKKPLLAKINLWHLDKKVNFIDIVEESEREMKFDVVIGNPPYQEDRAGTRAKQIYPDFMDNAYKIANRVILITPGRFLFNAGDTKKDWNKKMLKDIHLKVVFYEQDSSKVFPNTDIKGGVVITYRDSFVEGEGIGTFTPYPELNQILLKTKISLGNGNMSDIAFTPQGYKLTEKFHMDFPKESESLPNKDLVTTNIFDKFPHIFLENKSDALKQIKMYGRLSNGERVYRYVNREYINVVENFNKYKIFLPKSNGSGKLGEVLSSPIVAEPGIGHTQTFMSLGLFDSPFEAEALMKYIKSKFARTLLGALKITQDNPIRTWGKIPLQDFTSSSDIDWTKSIAEIDQQLYKKYKLSQEEIDFIEKNVREMI